MFLDPYCEFEWGNSSIHDTHCAEKGKIIRSYLLDAMSPVLHVEGLRTRPGSIVVGQVLSVARPFVNVAVHLVL